MTRIYMCLFFVGFSALCVGVTVGFAIAGKNISAPLLVIQALLLAFVFSLNAGTLKRLLGDK